MNNNEEITLKISRINIKSETFCTKWNGSLYCVDICEDAEERGAWLYESNSEFKMFMFGESSKNDRDEFLDCVFSSIPDYIEDYEKSMDIFEDAMCKELDNSKMTYAEALSLNESKEGLDLAEVTIDNLLALIEELPGWDYPLAEDLMHELAKRAGIDTDKYFEEADRDYSDLYVDATDKLGANE